jgi:GTP-binding protein
MAPRGAVPFLSTDFSLSLQDVDMKSSAPIQHESFLDEVDIFVAAGNGGDGCVSFRREKFIPKGGPDGGDGGHHLSGKHHHKAGRGGHGEGKNRHGKNGEPCIIPVPPGTLIYDADRDVLLKDLAVIGQRVRVAVGGRGGHGNAFFKSPTNQTPREFEPGTEGQRRNLHLQLKLIADVGLLGKPNAGKSTLLSRLSAARPKIAAYPFTTLSPYLGIVELSDFRRFVLADIPGLIEGAHQGAGLGDAFLRHIERTRILLHVVDIHPLAGDPLKDYQAICNELRQYSQDLADKPQIIVANKMDLSESHNALADLRKAVDGEVIAISAVTGQGLDELTEIIWKTLQEENDQCPKPNDQ